MDSKLEGLIKKYEPIAARYDSLTDSLESPEIIADNRLYLKLAEEKTSLEELHRLGEALKIAIEIGDEEEINALYICLTAEMLPKGEEDSRNAVIELRAENPQSAPFLDELFKLYSSYAKARGYKIGVCESEEKFLSFSVEGRGAYYRLKGETGTHRGTGGKIGNAAVWVSVLPELDDLSIAIKDSDLRTDIFHSSGAGGQNINKVATAVRLTHLPSGIAVVCKEERSQLQNRKRAHAVLRAKLYDYYKEKSLSTITREKRSVLNKSRTERVRMIDFDAETLTDLRINQTIPLKSAYGSGLDEIINSLILKESKR